MQKSLKIFILLIIFVGLSSAYSFPEIEGWERVDSVRTYTSDNLWNYINGAADIYLDFGFQKLKTGKFKSGDKIITLDIYNMGNQLNAFGIYVSERADQYKPLAIGTQTIYYPPYEINMLKDKYYVILRAQSDSLSQTTGKTLIQSISRDLPGDNSFPEILSKLPQKNKIADSETYIKKDFMGMASLKNCITADYQEGENKYKIFYFVDSKNNPANIWSRFDQEWEIEKSSSSPIKMRAIPYQGVVGLIKTDSGIFGVAELEEKEKTKNILLSIE